MKILSTSQWILDSEFIFMSVRDGNVCTISPIELSFMIKILILGTQKLYCYENKLTVIIIAKNEENIADCLDSISWADEIVLVDDYSVDNTEKIIKSKNLKIK